MLNRRRRRTPKLRYSTSRNIGYHVCYRDPETGTPRKHKFGMVSKAEAEVLYHEWVAEHLRGGGRPSKQKLKPHTSETAMTSKQVIPGSLAIVVSGFLRQEKARTRIEGGPKARGTISTGVYTEREQYATAFLTYLNEQHGAGAVGCMKLADLSLRDVEGFNRIIVEAGYSDSAVKKRMQIVKAIIDHAGRPDYGGQVLAWNWDARQTLYGRPVEERRLPTLPQLKRILCACDERETAMVWMGIGLGFGPSDLAVIRVGQIDEHGYDLRRGKTGMDRYGETPPLVWRCIRAYLLKYHRPRGELMFVTRNGRPLVHGRVNAVRMWWERLRKKLGETKDTLGGFYTLRHLGATEYGSRKGASINDIRRWLGHSASSEVADTYMKPVSPEYREAIEWVRAALRTGVADLRSDQSSEATAG